MTLSDRLASENGLVLLRAAARGFFAILVYLYFNAAATPDSLPLTAQVLFWGYLLAQGLLLWRGMPFGETFALLLDGVAIAFAVTLDPSVPPPTLTLFLVSLLSAGMLRGLGRYFTVLVANVLVVFILLVIRRQPDLALDPGSVFLLAVMALCALYLGILLFRNVILTRKAQESTWSDPETGLITHHALVATAGWLLPLHDRLAGDLTVALVTPAQQDNLGKLADHLAHRLRCSDIAARYDRQVIAVLLPCTTLAAAENLLGDLRDTEHPFYASVMTLSDDQHGLEETLAQLRHHLGRAWGNSEHWLVHAPVPVG